MLGPHAAGTFQAEIESDLTIRGEGEPGQDLQGGGFAYAVTCRGDFNDGGCGMTKTDWPM